ncbi:chloroplast protein HCF243 [Striga asiatica]|uniref:Chloroplast protein HCF243 n=1 Tax=Striga asiatica TaxID=4170 RepID=A0A5A7R8S7_STRAF|nr:chloroplast protein HCF243 [Striga asiatica]
MDLIDHNHKPNFRTTSTGHTTTTTSTAAAAAANELLICFASRPSSTSSSMKLTRSLLSPGRAARDAAAGAVAGPVSLSSSLSRRLRSNGSLKGGASPFLAATGKRRAGGFENPEPSSPKVTCIGQVRVKTKKKKKQAKQTTRSLSKRLAGEISFRKAEQPTPVDGGGGGDATQVRYSNAGGHYHNPPSQECLPHRNQRWVHLPISICDALKEFSCLFPCKSSCFSRDRAEERSRDGPDEGGCRSVFARWLVSVNDGEGERRQEIELVVGGGDEEDTAAEATEEARVSMRCSRRHVFEDIEVRDDRIEIKGQSLEDEGIESARVSICIPPKNALLLMRCRSDPMKMASLAGRFSWDSQGACKNDSEMNEDEKMDEVLEKQDEVPACEGKGEVFGEIVDVLISNSEEQEEITDEADGENLELFREAENFEENKEDELLEENLEEMVEEKGQGDIELEKKIWCNDDKLIENDDEIENEDEDDEEIESNMSSFEALLNHENSTEHYEDGSIVQDEEEEEDQEEEEKEGNTEISQTPPMLEQEEALMEGKNEEKAENEEELSTIADKDPIFADEQSEESMAAQVKDFDPDTTTQQENEEENPEMEKSVARKSFHEPKKDEASPTLPECLLLMMCEPKLSMEVSKETWVCTTDFIRWLPERPRKAAAKAGKPAAAGKESRLSADSRPAGSKLPGAANSTEHPRQPPRSSCSLPAAAAAASMAAVIEQKLASAVGYEPFVLTRCKSEPMRTAAAKLMPESCFWKNAMRKMEPHGRSALGVGAAGVGF